MQGQVRWGIIYLGGYKVNKQDVELNEGYGEISGRKFVKYNEKMTGKMLPGEVPGGKYRYYCGEVEYRKIIKWSKYLAFLVFLHLKTNDDVKTLSFKC
jgi:hypothetical protein